MRRWVSFLSVVVSTLALLVVMPTAASAAPGAPVVVGPSGEVVQTTPVLSWMRVSGAVRYDVAVSTTADFATTAFTQSTANTHATPLKDLPVGGYFWRVRGVDSTSVVGPWSTASFTRANDGSPVLATPTDGATLEYPNSPLSYRWSPFAGAKTYELQVDDDPAFIGAPAPVTTSNTSYSPLNHPSFDTPVHWRVRAKSANNVYSAWSTPFQYTLRWDPATTVELVGPASTNGSSIEKVVLEWKAIRGAAYYQLDLSPDQNFNNPVYDDYKVVGNSFAPKATLPAGAYYWRVRPMSSTLVPQPGSWSDDSAGPWTFTKAWPASGSTAPRPQGTEDNRFDQVRLVAPADANYSLQQPELSWTPQRSASHYEVQLGVDANFSPGTYGVCLTDHTTLTPHRKDQGTAVGCSGLMTYVAPGSVRYWRVRAVDAPSGVLGAFSEVRSFLYDPANIDQTSPVDGSTVTTPVLRWSAVQNISRYKVTITNTSGASGCTQTVTATVWNTTYVPESLKRDCTGPWSWTVQGIEDDGQNLTRLPHQSGWPTFLLGPEAASASSPDPVVQTAGASYRPPLLDWPAVTGADGYRVYFSVAGANSYTPASLLTNQTAHAYTGPVSGSAFGPLMPPGTYNYYVQAFAGATPLSTSLTGSFQVTPMPVTSLLAPAHCPLSSCTSVEYDTPTLRWEPVSGAGMYLVYLATDSLFTNITKVYTTGFNSLTPAESLPDSQAGQATYWFVRPCATPSYCGLFDEAVFGQARAFRKLSRPVESLSATTPPAVSSSPVDNSVVFRWRDYLATNRLTQTAQTRPTGAAVDLEAASYQLQVSTTSNFTAVIDNVTLIDQTTYVSPTATYPDGPLYARVRAHDQTGNPLTWSSPIEFQKTTPAPTGLLPTGGTSTQGTPLLQWAPMASAAQYDVEVYKNPASPVSPTNLVGTVKTRLTTASLATALPAGQSYGWRVRRIDANGRQSSWSTLSTFAVAGPAPTLTSPANGTAVTSSSLLFSWSNADGRATSYKVESSTSPTFTSVLESRTTDMTSWAPSLISPVWPNGTVYWRVTALDPNLVALGTSATWSLTRDLSTAGEFTAVNPYRVLDTRTSGGVVGAGQSRTAKLTGTGTGIPASGVSTVVLNVTVTGPTAQSHLTLWAFGQPRPAASTINFAAGQTVANHATVPVDSSGRASVFNNAGSTHVIIDVVGYYSGGTLPRASRYTAAPVPARLVDTRGVDGAPAAALFSGESRLVEIAGLGGVPADATAVVMNVTAVAPTRAGHLDVYPNGSPRPTTSNVNFPAKVNVPNLVTMPLGSGGDVRVYNSNGTTHLLVDVVGWYSPGDPAPGSRFNPVAPARIVDTRTTSAPILAKNETRSFAVRGAGGVPNSAAVKAVVLNVTVTKPVQNGYLTVFETGTSRPTTSNLNFAAGQTVANQVIARVSADGKIAVYGYSSTHVLVDVVGWMG